MGDLILDRYVHGVVERISPEAPIQVLKVAKDERRLGGAASVANDLAALGARAAVVGTVGRDEAGQELRAQAKAAGIECTTVEDAGRPTSVKTRHLAGNHAPQQLLRVDHEEVHPLAPDVEARVVEALACALTPTLLVSDYHRGPLTLVLRRVSRGPATGRPVVDPKGEDFRATAAPAASAQPRAGGGRRRVPDPQPATRAGRANLSASGFAFVLLALDKDGMTRGERGGGAHVFRTAPREVFDVTGAGDMVLAVLGAALGAGASPAEAAELANVAAGLEVEKVGSVPVTPEEIAARLSERAPASGSKVVKRPKARLAAPARGRERSCSRTVA